MDKRTDTQRAANRLWGDPCIHGCCVKPENLANALCVVVGEVEAGRIANLPDFLHALGVEARRRSLSSPIQEAQHR